MPCIKTGCVAYLRQYGEWIYGDAHVYPYENEQDVIVIRAVWRGLDPTELKQFGNVRHFTIERISDWWDMDRTSMRQNSTLMAHVWVDHGYDGIPEPLLAQKESTVG